MEDNVRNALIILSGVVIAAIFIHGLWTIRKQKNPYKLEASKDQVKAPSRDFDRKGFDQDGVGQVKKFKHSCEPRVGSEQYFEQSISLDETSHLNSEQNDKVHSELNSQEQVSEHDIEKSKRADTRKEIILEKPVYQQPVTQAKPATQKVVNKKPNRKSKYKGDETKRPQIEINFGNGVAPDSEPLPSINIDESKEKIDQVKESKPIDNSVLEPKIIILSVVMPAHQQMSGAVLLPSLLTLGMKYGEMNIFHRHQDNAGNGAVTFSLANMLNPGSFELDTMETFVTQGVSLFMTLPNVTDPFIAFEQMLAAAKQLAAEFRANIVDDKRNIMTKQTEQHYVSNIREFDRKYRLSSVE